MRLVEASSLSASDRTDLRTLLDAAFGGEFTEEDWEHTIGGVHALVTVARRLVAHAAVVPRTIEVAGRPLRTGYLEGVATAPGHERRGHASAAIRATSDVILDRFELGALSTGVPAVYARLGWEQWRGPTFVRTAGGLVRTEDDDGGVMILRTPSTPHPDLDAPIACDWRRGDVW